MAEKPAIPQSQHALVRGDKMDLEWYRFFQKLAAAGLSSAQSQAMIDAAISALPDPEFRVHQTSTTEVTGNQDDGYLIALRRLSDSGDGAALWKFTRDEYGRVEGTEAATTDDLAEGATNLYWTAARSFVPTLIADGVTFSVPADCQALFTLPIELDGDAVLDVEGALIEVS